MYSDFVTFCYTGRQMGNFCMFLHLTPVVVLNTGSKCSIGILWKASHAKFALHFIYTCEVGYFIENFIFISLMTIPDVALTVTSEHQRIQMHLEWTCMRKSLTDRYVNTHPGRKSFIHPCNNIEAMSEEGFQARHQLANGDWQSPELNKMGFGLMYSFGM